jgi:hypothetical protein
MVNHELFQGNTICLSELVVNNKRKREGSDKDRLVVNQTKTRMFFQRSTISIDTSNPIKI